LRVAVWAGLFVVVAIAGYSGLPQLIIALIGSLLLLAYSAPPIRAKARPVLGLFVFSLVVAVPFFAGATVSNGWLEWRSPWTLLTLGWLCFMVLFFMAKGLVKNVPDFHGDLAAGLRTSATVLGSPERAARVAVLGTWFVYLLLPLTVFLTGSPSSIFLLAPWIVVACWHVCRLLADGDVPRLNQVLKWDMVVSVVTLAALAVSPRASIPAIVVVSGSLVILAVADLVGADSRSPEHLRNAH
jgi:4-hydroxybenzoate polyprenyltransferase